MHSRLYRSIGVGIALMIILAPSMVWAFSFSGFIRGLFGKTVEEVDASTFVADIPPSSARPFLEPVQNENPKEAIGGAPLQFSGGNALIPAIGPMGNIAEAEGAVRPQITTYIVREGDNLSVIAETFGVSIGTIFWANDIKSAHLIRPGDELIILPVSGASHTVKSGETIDSIAAKYKTSASEILIFNELAATAPLLSGQTLIIPNVDLDLPTTKAVTTIRGVSSPSISGYFIKPVNGGTRTQGIHGYNGVDLAHACGSPVFASAAGTVTIARGSGWNGGYGNYVVISHANGAQTVYAHLSDVAAVKDQSVDQGDYIGDIGTSGRSTGCHLHFEVRGARNPF